MLVVLAALSLCWLALVPFTKALNGTMACGELILEAPMVVADGWPPSSVTVVIAGTAVWSSTIATGASISPDLALSIGDSRDEVANITECTVSDWHEGLLNPYCSWGRMCKRSKCNHMMMARWFADGVTAAMTLLPSAKVSASLQSSEPAYVYHAACTAVEPLPSVASEVAILMTAVRRLPLHGVCTALGSQVIDADSTRASDDDVGSAGDAVGSQVIDDDSTSASDDDVGSAGDAVLIVDGVTAAMTLLPSAKVSASLQSSEPAYVYHAACTAVELLPGVASEVAILVTAVRRLPLHGVCTALGSQVIDDDSTRASDDDVGSAGDAVLIVDGVMRRWPSIPAVYTADGCPSATSDTENSVTLRRWPSIPGVYTAVGCRSATSDTENSVTATRMTLLIASPVTATRLLLRENTALESQVIVDEDVHATVSDDGIESAGDTTLIADSVMRRWPSIPAVYTSVGLPATVSNDGVESAGDIALIPSSLLLRAHVSPVTVIDEESTPTTTSNDGGEDGITACTVAEALRGTASDSSSSSVTATRMTLLIASPVMATHRQPRVHTAPESQVIVGENIPATVSDDGLGAAGDTSLIADGVIRRWPSIPAVYTAVGCPSAASDTESSVTATSLPSSLPSAQASPLAGDDRCPSSMSDSIHAATATSLPNSRQPIWDACTATESLLNVAKDAGILVTATTTLLPSAQALLLTCDGCGPSVHAVWTALGSQLIVDEVATSTPRGGVESAGDAMMIAAGDIATTTSTYGTESRDAMMFTDVDIAAPACAIAIESAGDAVLLADGDSASTTCASTVDIVSAGGANWIANEDTTVVDVAMVIVPTAATHTFLLTVDTSTPVITATCACTVLESKVSVDVNVTVGGAKGGIESAGDDALIDGHIMATTATKVGAEVLHEERLLLTPSALTLCVLGIVTGHLWQHAKNVGDVAYANAQGGATTTENIHMGTLDIVRIGTSECLWKMTASYLERLSYTCGVWHTTYGVVHGLETSRAMCCPWTRRVLDVHWALLLVRLTDITIGVVAGHHLRKQQMMTSRLSGDVRRSGPCATPSGEIHGQGQADRGHCGRHIAHKSGASWTFVEPCWCD